MFLFPKSDNPTKTKIGNATNRAKVKKKKSQLERKKAVVQPREDRRQNGGKSPPREKMEFIDYTV